MALGNTSALLKGPVSENDLYSNTGNVNIYKLTTDYVKPCPICKSDVKLFFINFNEKMLMCENTECEFPFGYEDLQFYKHDLEMESDEEVASISQSRSTTCSNISNAAWSEIDKLNRIYESEDSQLSFAIKKPPSKPKKKSKLKRFKNEEKLQMQIENLKKLSTEMIHIEKENNEGIITNEKWIKNLMCLEKATISMTGKPLLKPEEVQLLRNDEIEFTTTQIKIEIEPAQNSTISCIKIELADNKSNSSERIQNTPAVSSGCVDLSKDMILESNKNVELSENLEVDSYTNVDSIKNT